MEKVLMIGFGAIGKTILRAIADERELRVTHVLDIPARREALQQELGAGIKVIASLDELTERPDCALECAGHAAVKAHVPALLRQGIDVILASVGSLSDPGLIDTLEAAAREGGGRITLVPGAVPGIDALAAAKPFGLDDVTYIGRKPPIGWKDTPAEKVVDLDTLTTATTIFEGTAREAAQTYPKNANVAATIALAGLGLDKTRAQLIADPGVTRNVHTIKATGTFGDMEITIAGKPLADNPKTSSLAAFSVVRALRSRVSPIAI